MQRVFLDWDRPALATGADWLLGRARTPEMFDLRNLTVVLPGGRAQRRLLEVLLQRAATAGLPLAPPQIVTIGSLADVLISPPGRPLAGPLSRLLAWARALGSLPRERLARLFAELPAPDNQSGRLHHLAPQAEALDELHHELAGECLTFADVAEQGRSLKGFTDAERWQLLADIQRAYLQILDAAGLADPQKARMDAVENRLCRAECDIVLLGVADLNQLQCRMLDLVADRVTVLVHAPERLADRFDAHGRIIVSKWVDSPFAIPEDRITVVDGPEDQAAAAMSVLAGLGGEYSAEEITIGVPDEEVVPYLSRELAEQGIPSRYAAGRPAVRTGPGMLLRAASDYMEGRRAADLASLVRHPDVENWLRRRVPGVGAAWLNQLDEYRATRLPLHLDLERLASEGRYAILRKALVALDDLLKPFRGEMQPPAAWNSVIVGLLLKIYGDRPLARGNPHDRLTLEVCERIREMLLEHGRLPEALTPKVRGVEVLRLLLHRLESEAIPPEPDEAAIELVGWLELPLDDAPVAIVTGFNEGKVPQSLNADPFLPNRLRGHLGLVDNDRRYARDAYAVQAIFHSRPAVHVIAGRHAAEGDPLPPSRLLFACETSAVAQRVLHFLKPEPSAMAPQSPPPDRPSRFTIPKPRKPLQPITSLHVTQFRDYLACPYRFYLRHVEKLAGVSDRVDELDAAAFGDLIHRVLEAFGRNTEVNALTDPCSIVKFLSQTLDEEAARRFGRQPLPAVALQIENARLRLKDFARWQAKQATDGWRIAHVELRFDGDEVRFGRGERQVALHGIIDRIDFHEGKNCYRIMDYKTSDSAASPEVTHRKNGQWIDLQLPLYRYLARARGIAGECQIGFVVMPKGRRAVRFEPATWTEADFREAEAAAEDVVDQICAGNFSRRAPEPPAFCEDLAWICQDEAFVRLDDAGPDDPEEAE